MNLMRKVGRRMALALIVVLAVGALAHLLIFRHFLHHTADDLLMGYKHRIEQYIVQHDSLPDYSNVFNPPRLTYRQVDRCCDQVAARFVDTVLYNDYLSEKIPYRQLVFPAWVRGNWLMLTVNQATVEKDDLFYAIIISLAVLCLLFLIFTYLIGYIVSRNLWVPLKNNLAVLSGFDMKNSKGIELASVGISEFDQVNSAVMGMVQRMNEDFESTRLFAEDASHEMQAPLAVIRSKLELMLNNSKDYDSKHIDNVVAMSRAVLRLSQLNSSLLLIAKIRNHHYRDRDELRIDNILATYLSDMEEIVTAKKLNVGCRLEPCTLVMNPLLADSMVSNLLGNAIRHNIEGGTISILLDKSILSIKNSCATPEYANYDLLDRKARKSNIGTTNGLGLSIVRSICEEQGFSLNYEYTEDGNFLITVGFGDSES